MEGYVFRTWKEVEDWILLNKLQRWTISADRVDPGEKASRVVCNTIKEDDLTDKLKYTEQCLESVRGMRLYLRGWRTDASGNGTFYHEIYLDSKGGESILPAQMQQMIGAATSSYSKEELTAEIRLQVMNEVNEQRLKEERKKLDQDMKEFKDLQNSALGALVHYFGPIGMTVLKNLTGGQTAMAGTPQTAGETVQADRIEAKPTEVEEEGPFTDEEAAEIEALMTRFKEVEPDYLQLIRRVVEMAESGDSTYTMAKGFLIK